MLHISTECDAHYRSAAVQAADPLGVDAALAHLPQLNARGDVRALWALQQDLADRAVERLRARPFNDFESLAVMRDIGIVVGSVKRHGTEPLEITPELAPIMLALGWQTNLIPRDTVQHYTAWNPVNNRRRRYTSDPQETRLQSAVAEVYPQLSASLSVSSQLAELDPADARLAPLLEALDSMVVGMVTVIDDVVREVSPVFFAQTLRPYFEEIEVAGVSYLGPAAAQVPLWLVDLCLWASDRNSERYNAFLGESLPYALPGWRAFYERHNQLASVVTRVCASLEHSGNNPEVVRSATAAAQVLRTLKTFRGRHLGMAKKAYSVEVRLYENGSGGAPLELLKEIIDLTRTNESLMGRGTPAKPPRHPEPVEAAQ